MRKYLVPIVILSIFPVSNIYNYLERGDSFGLESAAIFFFSSWAVFFFYQNRKPQWGWLSESIWRWLLSAFAFWGPFAALVLLVHLLFMFSKWSEKYSKKYKTKSSGRGGGLLAAFNAGMEKTGGGSVEPMSSRRDSRIREEKTRENTPPQWARMENGQIINVDNGEVTYIQICPSCGKESTSGKQYWKMTNSRDKFGPINGVCSYCQHWYTVSISGPDA